MVEADTNGDGYLEAADAASTLASGPDAADLARLTPPGEDFIGLSPSPTAGGCA